MKNIELSDTTNQAEEILQEIDSELEKRTLTESSLHFLQQKILNKLYKMSKKAAQGILMKLWEESTPDRIKNEIWNEENGANFPIDNNDNREDLFNDLIRKIKQRS